MGPVATGAPGLTESVITCSSTSIGISPPPAIMLRRRTKERVQDESKRECRKDESLKPNHERTGMFDETRGFPTRIYVEPPRVITHLLVPTDFSSGTKNHSRIITQTRTLVQSPLVTRPVIVTVTMLLGPVRELRIGILGPASDPRRNRHEREVCQFSGSVEEEPSERSESAAEAATPLRLQRAQL